jgi:hypothetical protein
LCGFALLVMLIIILVMFVTPASKRMKAPQS